MEFYASLKKNPKQSHHICRKIDERENHHGKQNDQIEKTSMACFLSYEEPRRKIISIYVHIRVFVV